MSLVVGKDEAFPLFVEREREAILLQHICFVERERIYLSANLQKRITS